MTPPRFQTADPVTARWRSLDGRGLDHATLAFDPDRIVARGVAVGGGADAPFAVYYRIDCDPAWRVREVALGSADGAGLHLISDGQGRWASGTGEPLPEFDGCLDVDLSGTPLTNTLAIRRRRWRAGERAELRAAFVPLDTLQPFVDAQVYTCLEPGRRFRYEAGDGSFASELTIDEDGLVIDYPSLFARVL